MKILIKNALRLQADETGKDFRAVSGNIWIDGKKIVSLEKEPEGFFHVMISRAHHEVLTPE